MPAKRKPNIVLFTFDNCRADHLGHLGYGRNTSPFLDSLAENGVYFTEAFATGSGSPQSFVAILTSTYPLDYGGFAEIKPPRKILSEVLRDAGYFTIAVHSAAYLSDYFGYNRGWDIFRYATHSEDGVPAGVKQGTKKAEFLRRLSSLRKWFKLRVPPLGAAFQVCERTALFVRKIVKEIVHPRAPFYTAEEINEEVKNIIKFSPKNQPIFLWVHYMDLHEPYAYFWLKEENFFKRIKYHLADTLMFVFGEYPKINRFFRRLYIELYDASLSYADARGRELFSYLKAEEVINDDSLAIFSGDHGSEFFEKGSSGHGQRPFNANVHVPLIFYSKKLNPAAESRPVSLIDIPPTVLEFVGVSKPRVYKGKNIFQDEREVISQFIDCRGDLTEQKFVGAAIVHKGYKYIQFRGEKMLFAVGDENEEKNLYDERHSIADALNKKLKKYIPRQ